MCSDCKSSRGDLMLLGADRGAVCAPMAEVQEGGLIFLRADGNAVCALMERVEGGI